MICFKAKNVAKNKSTTDRRTCNSTTLADIADNNLDKRLTKFKDQLKNEYTYRILLRYFADVGNINFPLKIDFKIRCHLETEMKNLFESKKNVTTIGSPGTKIIFTRAPFVQYKQFLLDKNFRQYIETIMISKKYCVWVFKKLRFEKQTKFLWVATA